MMNTEAIPPYDLPAALALAQRSLGWNFRAVPIRTVSFADCTVYVVPAKLWAYHRFERRSVERRKRHAQAQT